MLTDVGGRRGAARRLCWAVGVLAVLLIGVVVAPSIPLSGGPLAHTVANVATQTTYGGRVRQRFTFGGFDFVNDSGAPYTIQAVAVTNARRGLTVHTFIYLIPRHGAIGAALGWVPARRSPLVIRIRQAW